MVKILVVEDEKVVARDLRNSLEAIGYQVPALASNSEQALAAIAEHHPDLVLMDIKLKGKRDGITLCEEITSTFDIPVIYLTAYSDVNTLARVQTSSAVGLLLKPFDERILATSITLALKKHHTHKVVKYNLLPPGNSLQASIAIHELQYPLSRIVGAVSALRLYGNELDEGLRATYLEQINAEANNAQEILDNILTLGEIDQAPDNFSLTYIDVVNFCREQVEALQFIHLGSYTISFQSNVESFYAKLEPRLLLQIVRNILVNAIKYSPTGGRIEMKLFCDFSMVAIEVRDWGIGIPPECLNLLGQPFYRCSNVGKIAGTGLGLTIVKRCIEWHNGDIQFQSSLGEGTSVTVILPREFISYGSNFSKVSREAPS
jgi:signal transduction histidine kinase